MRVDVLGVDFEVGTGAGEEEEGKLIRVNARALSSPPVMRRYADACDGGGAEDSGGEDSGTSWVQVIAFWWILMV